MDQINTSHASTCKICLFQLPTPEKLQQHINDNHNFNCEDCNNVYTSQAEMENHVLLNHVQPINGVFYCEECTYTTNNKTHYVSHYKKKHGTASKSIPSKLISRLVSVEDDLKKKNDELKQIKREFDTLNNKLSIKTKEVDKSKAEYESKIAIVNQKYADAVSENVILKERNDTLYRLSKGYLDAYGPNHTADSQSNRISTPSIRVTTDPNEIVSVTEVPSRDTTTNNTNHGNVNNDLQFRPQVCLG